MKRIILLIFVFIFKFSFSQEIEDPRLLVGVTHFTTSGNPAAERFSGFITERVLDILNQSNRFRVVNLTSESADKDVKERAETNYKAQNWKCRRHGFTTICTGKAIYFLPYFFFYFFS